MSAVWITVGEILGRPTLWVVLMALGLAASMNECRDQRKKARKVATELTGCTTRLNRLISDSLQWENAKRNVIHEQDEYKLQLQSRVDSVVRTTATAGDQQRAIRRILADEGLLR